MFLSSVQNPSFHILHYKILDDSSFSDHHPISLLINLSASAPPAPRVVSIGRVMLDFFKEAKDSFHVLWDALSSQMPTFTKLTKVVKFYKQFCIAKAIEARLEETKLTKSLEFWQVHLHYAK